MYLNKLMVQPKRLVLMSINIHYTDKNTHSYSQLDIFLQ